MNKAKRLLDNMDEDERKTVIDEIGCIDDNASPKKQAVYIDKYLGMTAQKKINCKSAMRKCGKCCISNNVIKTAQKIYGHADNIENFLEKLNEAGIGGGSLRIDDGKIIGVYDRCYCNVPKKIDKMNKTYCECSAGWFETLFSTVFEKEVKVKIRDTILNGADKCTFEIMCDLIDEDGSDSFDRKD